jgi:hypothetical protein
MGQVFGQKKLRGKGFFPPGFKKTMGPADDRLPPLAHGLAVIDGDAARFYPSQRLPRPIEDELAGSPLLLSTGDDDIPFATRPDGTRPMQLFMRWYGFSYTWPHGELYQAAEKDDAAAEATAP